MSRKENTFSTQDITEAGMMISLAIILGFVKIPLGATGGSINLQILPLFIFSLRKGWLKGFIVSGVLFGIITCLIDTSGSLINYPLDYLVGFGSSCLIGLFSNKIKETKNRGSRIILLSLSGLLATLGRLIGSTLSSILIYKYTFWPAVAYNVLYIIPSGIAAISVLCVIYESTIIKYKN